MPKSKNAPSPPKVARRNLPSEISEGVFVGGWKDAENFEGVRFCVLDERPDDMPEGTHVPIYDAAHDRAIPANLDRVAQGMRAARAKGMPVLVYCGHGVRRSPLAAAWYLHRAEGLPLDAAFARVRTARPRVEPPAGWIGDVSNLSTA